MQKGFRAKFGKKLPGPLDCVDINFYLALWRTIGATVGVIHNGEFIWERETLELEGGES